MLSTSFDCIWYEVKSFGFCKSTFTQGSIHCGLFAVLCQSYCFAYLGSCGGVYSGSMYGTINSPGYPQGYANNLLCSYYISIPRGTILLAFQSFSIEHEVGCARDVLVVSTNINILCEFLLVTCWRFHIGEVKTFIKSIRLMLNVTVQKVKSMTQNPLVA